MACPQLAYPPKTHAAKVTTMLARIDPIRSLTPLSAGAGGGRGGGRGHPHHRRAAGAARFTERLAPPEWPQFPLAPIPVGPNSPIPAPIAAAVDAAIWHPGYPEAGYEPPIRRVVVDES